MAFLKTILGNNLARLYEISGERVVFGRHPDCDVVLDGAGVSRRHAQIMESHGQYYIEDLRSRNGTFVNGTEVENRTELDDNDCISLCNYSFCFHLTKPSDEECDDSGSSTTNGYRETIEDASCLTNGVPLQTAIRQWDDSLVDSGDSSSIITTVDVESSSRLRLNVNPELKLKAVLEISRTLAHTLDLDQVLTRILDGLFNIFPQADEGFVLLRDVETTRLTVHASRVRHAKEDDAVRISTTIVNQAMNSREGILSADASEDSRFSMSESIDGLRIKSMICAPLFGAERQALGVIQIATWDLRQQFSEDDLDLLISVASQVCLAIENAYLHQTAMEQRDLARDLDFAMQVQLGFLPKKRPKLEGYSFFDYYEAAQRVGGDFFDYVTLSDGRVVVVLADVAGKGIPAALLMARLYSSVRFHILTNDSLSDAVAGLNKELSTGGLGHRFVTLVVVVIDPQSHDVTIANAGHLPPLRRSANHEVQPIARSTSGMPLGIMPDQEFSEATVHLDAGDSLILYTDGVTEAMNPRRAIYGSKRLRQFIANGPAEIADLIEGIIADVEEFAEGRSQNDDICLVGFSRSA